MSPMEYRRSLGLAARLVLKIVRTPSQITSQEELHGNIFH